MPNIMLTKLTRQIAFPSGRWSVLLCPIIIIMLTSPFLGLVLPPPLPDRFFNLNQEYGTIYFRGWVAEIAFPHLELDPIMPILTPGTGTRGIPAPIDPVV